MNPAPVLDSQCAAFIEMESRTPVPGPEAALAELTGRMVRGEETAFTSFHETYFPRLFRYVLVLMRGDEEAAQDVTQETLLRVVRHVRVIDQESAFWSWLTCLARSAAADHSRRTSRYRRLLDAFRPNAVEPPELAATHDLREIMARALAQLPAAEAELLTRIYYEGNSVRAMATALHLTEAAIDSRLVRARKVLRQTVFRLLRHE